MVLLRQISLREFRKHLLRHVLTVLGIVLGVAIFSAARSANSSLKLALRDTIDQIAGKAVLQVTAGSVGVQEGVLDVVRSVSGVRAAVPVIEAVVRTAESSQGNILMLGVDMAGDRSMRDYKMEGDEDAVSDPLVFLAQPDSIIVSKEFAARNQLREDSSITLQTAIGSKRFTVRGIMAPQGMAKAFGGNLGVMDIYSAQFAFSRGRFFDRIDVALEDGVKLETGVRKIRDKLGPGFRIEPPLRRGKQTESLMEAFSLGLLFSSFFALMIGLFLIFNAFSISVTQRRTQIGILRALGATQGQIRRLFLAESVVLGILGSLAGVAAGALLGRGMMVFMARIAEQTYGVQVHVERLHVDPFWSAFSVAAGIAASLVGAYLPARAAGRVDPAVALQKGKYQVLFIGENRIRRWIGFGLLLISMIWGFSSHARMVPVQIAVFAAIFVGLSLLAPTFSHLLAIVLRKPMARLFDMEGQLASDSLVQAPRRTSATVSALMFSLAFVLIMASFSVSVKASLMQWVDLSVNADLFVAASQSLAARNFQFPPSIGDELRKIPGVRQVDSVRLLQIDFNGVAPMLVSIELDQYLRRSTPLMEEGRLDELLPGMMGKNGILISNNFARLHNLHKGSSIALDTPTGRHEFNVVGVSADYTSESGSLMIDRRVYERLWNDDRVDTFDLMLEKGYDPASVRAEIHRRLAGSRNIFVLTNEDMRAEILRLTDQFFALQYVQLVVAVIVAVLGIINSLMISITERKREIAILRSLGGEKRQVCKAIILEAVCIGMVALAMGIAAGALMGYYMVESFGAAVNGWIFPYRFPYAMAFALVPGVVLVSFLSAWYPSSLALRTPIVEGLAYE